MLHVYWLTDADEINSFGPSEPNFDTWHFRFSVVLMQFGLYHTSIEVWFPALILIHDNSDYCPMAVGFHFEDCNHVARSPPPSLVLYVCIITCSSSLLLARIRVLRHYDRFPSMGKMRGKKNSYTCFCCGFVYTVQSNHLGGIKLMLL